jgi:hypothetical protein
MSWLDELLDWWRERRSPRPPAPVTPPRFTRGPDPFGVGRDVAGVEWETDVPTSGEVYYAKADVDGPWTAIFDDSRQRPHQRTLAPLEPNTEYQARVKAIVPAGSRPSAMSGIVRFRTLALPGPEPAPAPEPAPPLPPGTDPIAHPAATVNLLAYTVVGRPWLSETLTYVDPSWAEWLLRYCLGGPTTLIVADLAEIPGQMRRAGFRGRDNALWYTLSRSYAEWPWHGDPNDPDGHLSDQRRELHDFWWNYLDVILSVMRVADATRAVLLENDGPDRCGDQLSAYSLRQLAPVADRCARGDVFEGVVGLATGDPPGYPADKEGPR